MQSYSNEQLSEITSLAEVFFTPKEIAMILEVDPQEFIDICNDAGTEVGKAFNKGKLMSEFKVRKSIVQLANSGSSPAQAMVLEMMKQQKINQLDRE